MISRKEEERNEKIIRGLMKLPPNRRCINCNSLGPQYVCTNFWTFVCMTCSGIHREFNHRVKSVSMSKFTSQEVESLQEGGNQRARETFLRDWDPREQRLPDNSNVDKVRDFIKSVYVDKKFFASKASGKPPRDTLNHRNHEDETRRASSYHSYSQSPPYDYQYEERRYGKQAPALTKKPGSDRGIVRFLSTSRLSDHMQEDRFANEVVNARVSDYSLTNGGDLFRSSTQSPRSLSRSSGSGKFDGLDLFSPPSRPQFTTSASFVKPGMFDGLNVSSAPNPPHSVMSTTSVAPEKFDGLDLFSAPNPPQFVTSASFAESGKSDGLDLFSGKNLPQSATSATFGEPGKFDGLDLFKAPNLPQSATSAPFSEPGKFDGLDVSSAPNPPPFATAPFVEPENFDGLDLFSAPNPPQPATLVPIAEHGKFDGLDLFEILAASSASVAPTLSVNQEFKAFEPSDLFTVMPHQQSMDIMTQKNEGWATFDTPLKAQPSQQDTLVTNPFLTWELSEDGAQSHGLDIKSCNPFDLPSEAAHESRNMLFDMSYIQSALPNYNMSFAPGDSQDTLVIMAGQAPSMQIPSIKAQGPVASVGGNPFA